ncbi:V-type ATP synthase subunit F [Candidatus Micrarchaeota archaeon]|nr:V-type ATP synthase subunit F [Candidatus Micrarchaeota archaeon]MBU2477138.1 V-type ATP synthase subunit F [Candidatus Micrarchaeota archaeon]
MDIAVLGTDDFVTGFRLAGVRNTFVVANNFDEKIDEVLGNKEIGVIVIEQEEMDKMNPKTKRILEKLITPVLITLSSKGKETDLRELIKRTVGVDLWK